MVLNTKQHAAMNHIFVSCVILYQAYIIMIHIQFLKERKNVLQGGTLFLQYDEKKCKSNVIFPSIFYFLIIQYWKIFRP